MVAGDRITQIRIENLRCVADVTIALSGLSVLIGDNGSGKSSIIEAFESLRYFGDPGANVPDWFRDHTQPVRAKQGAMTLGVHVEDPARGGAPPLRYRFSLAQHGRGPEVVEEHLDVGPLEGRSEPLHVIIRSSGRDDDLVFDQGQRKLVRVKANPNRLLLSDVGSDPRHADRGEIEQSAIRRVAEALRKIEVHVPFDVMPAWVARRGGRRSASREAAMLQPAKRLELLAANLANVYHSLKNDFGAPHWQETMEYVRLGLGDDIDDVSASADASGGQHAISVRYKSLPAVVPAAGLSDGTLAYLAFVALFRLPSDRTVLAFDEPELHMHPGLLARIVSMFETLAKKSPVVVSTHSDRFLDTLEDPAASAVLCELDETRSTALRRPDPATLERWLAEFRGLGDLRAAGLDSAVMEVRDRKR